MPKKDTKKVEQEEQEEQVEEQEEQGSVKSISPADLEVERIFFRAQEMNPDATQVMCFPKYLFRDDENNHELTLDNFDKHGENLIVVTGPIKMAKGGIPKYNPKYHPDGENSMRRAYFYIPKVETDANSMELFDCIQRIDDYMHEEINVKKNAGGVLCALNSKKKE